MYFGDNYHPVSDSFSFSFGCIAEETKIFYTQKADGIVGMGMGKGNGIDNEIPLYQAMKDANIIQQRMFNLCFGKNGGFFQIGGFNQDKMLSPIVWYPLWNDTRAYKFNLNGVKMGDRTLEGSEMWTNGFIDTGTTFTYIPFKMFEELKKEFDTFCNSENTTNVNGVQKCPGKRTNGNEICFSYDQGSFHGSLKEFFLGYPIIYF